MPSKQNIGRQTIGAIKARKRRERAARDQQVTNKFQPEFKRDYKSDDSASSKEAEEILPISDPETRRCYSKEEITNDATTPNPSNTYLTNNSDNLEDDASAVVSNTSTTHKAYKLQTDIKRKRGRPRISSSELRRRRDYKPDDEAFPKQAEEILSITVPKTRKCCSKKENTNDATTANPSNTYSTKNCDDKEAANTTKAISKGLRIKNDEDLYQLKSEKLNAFFFPMLKLRKLIKQLHDGKAPIGLELPDTKHITKQIDDILITMKKTELASLCKHTLEQEIRFRSDRLTSEIKQRKLESSLADCRKELADLRKENNDLKSNIKFVLLDNVKQEVETHNRLPKKFPDNSSLLSQDTEQSQKVITLLPTEHKRNANGLILQDNPLNAFEFNCKKIKMEPDNQEMHQLPAPMVKKETQMFDKEKNLISSKHYMINSSVSSALPPLSSIENSEVRDIENHIPHTLINKSLQNTMEDNVPNIQNKNIAEPKGKKLNLKKYIKLELLENCMPIIVSTQSLVPEKIPKSTNAFAGKKIPNESPRINSQAQSVPQLLLSKMVHKGVRIIRHSK